MSLIRLDEAFLAYGDHALLDEVHLAIENKERIGLVGRNGMGKSTLMKVLAGTEKLDSGVRNAAADVQVNYLEQELPPSDDTTVFDFLAEGLSEVGELLKRYEQLTHGDFSDSDMKELERVQEAIELNDGWAIQQRIVASLSDLGLEGDVTMDSLSGGWRKRVAIARSLLAKPDVLLLDEPTNHLDIPAIEWLQKIIRNSECALVLITHDRRFLNEVVNKIIWLDRGKVMSFPGNYTAFLKGKEEFLAVEEKKNALFDKRLAEEEVWIRQGIKARRTRNEGRVRALEAMRRERKERVNVRGNVKMQIDDTQRSGKKVAELKNVGFGYDGKIIINNANVLVQRGDRIGLIGRNGAGKSTLIKLILGQLEPTEGSISLGTSQKIAYFDQTRDQLNESQSVADNLSEGRDSIEINGKQKHVMSYLADFLFTPQRVRSPVSTLSGGEKNRLLLAKLFSKPANVLVLDEPTNDLDIETLELLEELVGEYKGTVLVASHDRDFVDNIVTGTLFIDDNGRVHEHVGGFEDLIRQYGSLWKDKAGFGSLAEDSQSLEADAAKTAKEAEQAEKTTAPVSAAEKPAAKKVKLSYKLQRELDELPLSIDEQEQLIAKLEQEMSDPAFFQGDHEHVSQVTKQLSDAQSQLETYFSRWDELEQMTQGA